MLQLTIDREEDRCEVVYRLQIRPTGYVVGELRRRRHEDEIGEGRVVSFLIPPHDLDFLVSALDAGWSDGEPDRSALKGDYLLRDAETGRWVAAADDAALSRQPALSALVARLRDGADRAAGLSRPG